MKIHLLSRLPGRIVPLLCVAATLLTARGQTAPPGSNADAPPTVLDDYAVTATRTTEPAKHLGAVTDVVTAADADRMQVTRVSDLLGLVTGAPPTPSGAAGSITSLFMRGANSNQTLFMVDGIRLNDPNADYQVFLGGARLGANDRVEVVHGPQSTLYGGEAVGGVVAIGTQRGRGAPTASVSAEAGSFGTVNGALTAQGAQDAWGYAVSVSGGTTENQRANNDFTSTNAALRLDRTVTSTVNVSATLRWLRSDYEDPGDRYTDDPNNRERENNVLATVFAEFDPSEQWSSRLTLGDQERRFVTETPAPNPPYGSPSATTTLRNRRAVLDWQTTYKGLEGHRITAGVNGEATHTKTDGFGLIDKRQSLLAFFAQDEFTPVENVFLTAGLRSDDYDTFGRATTGRATAAWLIAQQTVKLRASYGTAFRAPSFLDLYGTDAYYVGNPHLRSEKAHGWDAGVDFYLPEKRGTLSATWFETTYSDLIVYDFAAYPSTVVNADRARTQGVELSAKLALPGAVELRTAYTYLEAENLGTHARLLRRPRHSFTSDLWHDFGHGVSAGAGLSFMADRQDVDAATFATIKAEDCTVARVYVAWQVNPRLALKARIENALDEKYEAVNGYPSPGCAVFAGAEWKF
ncbi:MAG: TonB-dependent receptor [Verrucomicrobia bacterium]|nr:TonB-dependent receptor [Verrucomicrobiota bacterium]